MVDGYALEPLARVWGSLCLFYSLYAHPDLFLAFCHQFGLKLDGGVLHDL